MPGEHASEKTGVWQISSGTQVGQTGIWGDMDDLWRACMRKVTVDMQVGIGRRVGEPAGGLAEATLGCGSGVRGSGAAWGWA